MFSLKQLNQIKPNLSVVVPFKNFAHSRWQLWFQRRRFKCESLQSMTDRQRAPSDGKSSDGLWPGEIKIGLEIIK
jgi:hypothetical protein